MADSDEYGSEKGGSDSEDDFSEISMYFDERRFSEFSVVEKQMYLTQKRRYDASRTEIPGLVVQPPLFMIEYSNLILKRKKAEERAASKRARIDNPSVPKRASGRIKDAAVKTSQQTPQPTVDPADDEGPDFPVKIYFTPSVWSTMSLLVKRHAQNALEDYQTAISNGKDVPLPKFMTSGRNAAASSSASTSYDTSQNMDGMESQTASSHGRDAPFSKLTTRRRNPAASLSASTNNLDTCEINVEMESQTHASSHGKDAPFSKLTTRPRNAAASSSASTSYGTSQNMDGMDGMDGIAGSSLMDMDMDVDVDVDVDVDMGMDMDHFNLDLNNVKSAIEKAIKAAVPQLEARKLAELQNVLEEKGVESVDDFKLVDASYFDGHGLKDIQIKKIMGEFLNYGSDKENVPVAKKPQQKQKKAPAPLMRPIVEQPTIASRPQLSTKVIDVGIMDLRIEFSQFSDSLLKSLEKKQVPTANDRVRMVSILGHDINKKYSELRKKNPSMKQKTPGREVYKKVVAALFVDYEECFKDTLNNVKFKTGTWSLENQLETCVENMCRPKRPRGERAASSKGNRSAACILPEKYSIAMTKKMQGEAETIRMNLVSIYRASRDKWDWTHIKEMLKKESSLGAQRALINSRTRDVTYITEKWPFLSERAGLLCHLDEITGQSLAENFENFVDTMDDLISYLLSMSPQRIKLMRLKKEVDLGSGEHRRVFAALVMLAIHWEEDVSLLASLVEETTLPHEVEDLMELPSTPHIIALGTSFYTARKFFVFLDKKCLCSNLNNLLEALEVMCAAYFIFGVLYPHKLSNTLTYFERMVANLSDGDGLLKAQTAKGAQATSSFTKVKKLTEDISQFQKELDGDD